MSILTRLRTRESDSIRVDPTQYVEGGDTVSDVVIRQGSVQSKIDFIKHGKDIIKDDARALAETAVINSAKNKLEGVLGTENTQDIEDIVRYGSKAKGAIANQASKLLFATTGLDTSPLINSWLKRDKDVDGEGFALGAGAASIDSLMGRLRMRADPQQSFRYRLFMPTLPGPEGSSGMQLDFMKFFNYYSDQIDISLPAFTDEAYFRNGTYVYYPKFSDVGTFSITMVEDHHGNVTRYFNTWRQLVRDPATNLYYPPSVYKHNVVIVVIDARGEPSGAFVGLASFPTGPITQSYSGGSSDAVKITQEFRPTRLMYVPNNQRSYAPPSMMAVNALPAGAVTNPATIGSVLGDPLGTAKKLLRL